MNEKREQREGGNERNCQEICASKARNKWNMRSSNEPLSKKGAKGQKPNEKGNVTSNFWNCATAIIFHTRSNCQNNFLELAWFLIFHSNVMH